MIYVFFNDFVFIKICFHRVKLLDSVYTVSLGLIKMAQKNLSRYVSQIHWIMSTESSIVQYNCCFMFSVNGLTNNNTELELNLLESKSSSFWLFIYSQYMFTNVSYRYYNYT